MDCKSERRGCADAMRGPVSPGVFPGLGYLTFAALPWWTSAPVTLPRAAFSLLAAGLGGVLIARSLPRPLRSQRVAAARAGLVGVRCELGEDEAHPRRRFVLRGRFADGSECVLGESDEPACIVQLASRFEVPIEYRWGAGEPRREPACAPFEVRAYPWPGRERIRGIQLLLVGVLALAWVIVLGGSQSKVLGLSLFLSLGSWLFMVAVAALLVLDEVRLVVTDRWVVERRRMGLFRSQIGFDAGALGQLQVVGPARGQHFLVLTGTSTGGESGSWSWPIEPSAALEIEARLRRPAAPSGLVSASDLQ